MSSCSYLSFLLLFLPGTLVSSQLQTNTQAQERIATPTSLIDPCELDKFLGATTPALLAETALPPQEASAQYSQNPDNFTFSSELNDSIFTQDPSLDEACQLTDEDSKRKQEHEQLTVTNKKGHKRKSDESFDSDKAPDSYKQMRRQEDQVVPQQSTQIATAPIHTPPSIFTVNTTPTSMPALSLPVTPIFAPQSGTQAAPTPMIQNNPQPPILPQMYPVWCVIYATQPIVQTRGPVTNQLQNAQQPSVKTKEFTCALCDAVYKQKYSLDTHIRAKHYGETFQCPYCTHDGYESKRGLTYHIETQHTQNTYSCDICQKTFRAKDSLNKHIKNSKRHKKRLEKQQTVGLAKSTPLPKLEST